MNQYWTKDYYTGVNLLKGNLKLHSDDLQAELSSYKQFQNDCWLPFWNSLLLLKDNKNTKPLVQYWEKQNINESLNFDIIDILEKNSLQLNKFILDLKLELDPILDMYSNDLSLVKENKYECERLINLIEKFSLDENNVKSNEEQQQQEHEKVEEKQEEVIKDELSQIDNFSNMQFPLSIDRELIFQDMTAFQNFINGLKNKVKFERNLMASLQHDKFTGTSLIAQLKKLNIDTSLFNINRLAQELLTLNVFENYNISHVLNLTTTDKIWNENNYYIWSDEFDKQDKKSDEKNSVKKVKNEQNSVSSWFTSFNKLSLDSTKNKNSYHHGNNVKQNNSFNLEETIVQLNNCQDKFFQRYNKLEYDKLQLEQNLYNFIKRKEQIIHHNKKIMLNCKGKFNQVLIKFNNNINLTNYEYTEGNKNEIVNSSTVDNVNIVLNNSFYTRDNCISFVKWFVHNYKNDTNKIEDSANDESNSPKTNNDSITKITYLESIFGIRKINKDTINSIELLLRNIRLQTQINKTDDDDLLKIWQNNLNLIRVTNLKKEFHNTFLDLTISEDINYNTITKLFDQNKSTSKILLSDWIDLFKLFLLELPDSIIPSSMVDKLGSNDMQWLDLLPLENLQILILFGKYLQFLETDKIKSLFFNYKEMPFFHYILRLSGVSKTLNNDIDKYSEFAYQTITKNLNQLISNLELRQNQVKNSPASLTEPPTITVQEVQEEESLFSSSSSPSVLDIPKRKNHSRKTSTKAPTNLHKRSLSATVIFDSLKNLANDDDRKSDDDEDFVPLPFKTSSTPNSPKATSSKEKRKSGINLLPTTN